MFLKYLIVFLISMVPLIELRGAIPVALSPSDMVFFGGLHGMGLPVATAYAICIIGNMIPVPIIFFFARKVLEWGADKKYIGKFFRFCLEKGHKGGTKLQEKAGRGLYFKKSVIAVLLGVVMAGVIMGLVSAGVFAALGAAL